MSEEPSFEAVLELLTDESVRTILEATSVESLSAAELAKRCEASKQTVYRRLEELEESSLVESQARVREDGHHDTTYTASLQEVSITLDEGSLDFDVEYGQSEAADRLTDMWRKL